MTTHSSGERFEPFDIHAERFAEILSEALTSIVECERRLCDAMHVVPERAYTEHKCDISQDPLVYAVPSPSGKSG